MQEAEVSLRKAFFYIVNGLTDKDVNVSIDGAHIKTGNTVHFDIDEFKADNDCHKIDGNMKRWQGEYRINGYIQKVIVSSVPGIGDVNIECKDGKQLYIESKKGKNDKKGQEYPLMREAIGQLMTGCRMTKNVIAIVAVPYSEKSYNLAMKWAEFEQMTYAKRRSHDLTYYQYPEKIIAGVIKAPYIELNNEKIVLCHMFSVVFAWFFKKYQGYYGSVDDFLKISGQGGESAVTVLSNILKQQPEDLKEALEFVVPQILSMRKYVDIDHWKWVDYLLKDNKGALVLAEANVKEIIGELEELKKRLDAERRPSDNILKIENTYLKKDILSFLSSSNVLPKYGFPVDVVNLDILHNGEEAKAVSISRDLKFMKY